jgi:5-hydroxyisourate hydrolase-like protein (transthyretin family)
MVVVYALLWLVEVFELRYQRPFGVVVDAVNGHPQPLSVVQLTSKNEGEPQTVVRSTITDSRGRFMFIVRPSKYDLTASKEDYLPEEKSIRGDSINIDVKLKSSRDHTHHDK